MQRDQKQAYDRGITIFSPDGRLYQVEYAREAVKRGAASVGVRTEDGVVLAAERRVRSPLLEAGSIEKLHRVDDRIALASAGHVADGRRLVEVAREAAQRERVVYGQEVDVETLTKAVTDHVQEYTQTGGARPYGSALLFGGYVDGDPRLFEADPSGTPHEWQATAIGGDSETLLGHLEDEYRPDADLAAGVDLALSTLAAGGEDDELAPGEMDLLVVTESGIDVYDEERIGERLQELGLLDADGEE